MAPVALKQRRIENFSEPDVCCQTKELINFSSKKKKQIF
jgi:hypothetical protein